MHRPDNIRTAKGGDGDTLTRSSARSVSFAADVVFERAVGPEPLTPYRPAPAVAIEPVRTNWHVSDRIFQMGFVWHSCSTTFLNNDPNNEIEKLVVNSRINERPDLEYVIYVKPNASTETRVRLIRLTGGSFLNPMRFLVATDETTKRAALNYILSPQVVTGGNNVHPNYFESEHQTTVDLIAEMYNSKSACARMTFFYNAKLACQSCNVEDQSESQNSRNRLVIR